MNIFKTIWPPLVWFGLACYVIWRVLNTDAPIDIIFAAWLGGIVSVICVIVATRLARRAKEAKTD